MAEPEPSAPLLAFRSIADIPFARAYGLDPDALREASGVNRISELTPKNVVVLDSLRALAATTAEEFYGVDDTAEALGSALSMAVANRHLLWLSALPISDVEPVQRLLGEGLVHRVGREVDVDKHSPDSLRERGESVVPVAVSPAALVDAWAHGSAAQRELLAYMADGADTLVMEPGTLGNLRRVGARLIERNRLVRFLANPKVIAYLVILVYSSLRALPVVFVPGFSGNVWVLWAIDILTAIPYTWGIIELFAGRSLARRMLGLAVTLVTFISPYVYFWLNGSGYPGWVVALVGALIGGSFAVEYLRWLRNRTVRAVLAS